MLKEVQAATGIPALAFNAEDLEKTTARYSVAQKMSLASKRD